MPAHRRTATAAVVLGALGAGLVAWGASGPRDAFIPLYSGGVVVSPAGSAAGVPVGSDVRLHAGTRVQDDPSTTTDDALADEQRAWLAAGDVPGADGPYADMVTDALLDLHTLLLDDGAAVAGWSGRWRYVWPRDASFVAVALARTGHGDDARDVLGFLADVQGPDGSFEARYLPDGSGVPDDRAPQTDGTGWVLWAAAEVVAAAHAPDGLRIRAIAGERVPVLGAFGDLVEITEILLENAAKYAGEAATVTVSLRDEAGSTVLEVGDDGPGLDADDLAQVGNRFWRSDRHRGLPGTGLGLTIVRQLALAHDGDMRVSRSGAGGLLVRVEVVPQ
jgi:anti-sigma regulatory factor (Ser/Thr protein kinase)